MWWQHGRVTSPSADPGGSLDLRRTLAAAGLVFALLVPVGVVLGALVEGWSGVWGALLGLAVPAIFLSITAVVAVLTARLPATTMGAIVLGSWLVKIVFLLAILVGLRGATFYSTGVFFVAFLAGLVAYLAVETISVLRTRQAYVTPM